MNDEQGLIDRVNVQYINVLASFLHHLAEGILNYF